MKEIARVEGLENALDVIGSEALNRYSKAETSLERAYLLGIMHLASSIDVENASIKICFDFDTSKRAFDKAQERNKELAKNQISIEEINPTVLTNSVVDAIIRKLSEENEEE